MPVISCGGMRYQFKWQDVEPQEIPPRKPGEPRGHHPPRAGTGHQPHRNRARLRHVGNAAGPRSCPALPRDKIIVQTKVSPKASAKEFLRTFDTSMKYLRLDHVDLLALHGINNRATARLVAEERRLPGRGAQAAEGRPRPVPRLFHPRHDGHHSRSGQQRRVRLREPALVFRQRPELAGGRGGARARHGRVHHQPQRQGRQALRTAARSWSNCARR